jgi:hypothetical protein
LQNALQDLHELSVRRALQMVFTCLCLIGVGYNISFLYAEYGNYSSISRLYQYLLILLMIVSMAVCQTYMCVRAHGDKRMAMNMVASAASLNNSMPAKMHSYDALAT